MAQYDELISIIKSLLNDRFYPMPSYVKGLLGDGLGNVEVAGKPDMNKARFNRGSIRAFEIFNKSVPKVDGWPILIGEYPWEPGLTQVVGTDWQAYQQSGWGESVSTANPHAPTHVWRDGFIGADPLSIYMRAIAPGRGYAPGATGTTVFVNSFEYGTGTVWPGTPGVDLQPIIGALPTGSALLAGVYVEPLTNTMGVVTGTTDVDTLAFDPPFVTFPWATIPIARVRLRGGQGAIGERDFRDARRLWDVPQGSNTWKLVARDGDPNPAWSVDASGDLVSDGGGNILGTGSNEPNIGSTTEAEKFGNIYVAGSSHLDGDNNGNVSNRLKFFGFAPKETFKNGADEQTWGGYASYTGFDSSPNVSYSDGLFRMSSSSSNIKIFRYITGTAPSWFGRLLITNNIQAGFRIDDASDDNYYQVYVEATVAGGPVRLVEAYQTGGGGETVNVSSLDGFNPADFYILRIRVAGVLGSAWGGRAALIGYNNTAAEFGSGHGTSESWTPTRFGLYYSKSVATAHLAKFDWVDWS